MYGRDLEYPSNVEVCAYRRLFLSCSPLKVSSAVRLKRMSLGTSRFLRNRTENMASRGNTPEMSMARRRLPQGEPLEPIGRTLEAGSRCPFRHFFHRVRLKHRGFSATVLLEMGASETERPLDAGSRTALAKFCRKQINSRLLFDAICSYSYKSSLSLRCFYPIFSIMLLVPCVFGA